jgi:cell division protein FtsL
MPSISPLFGLIAFVAAITVAVVLVLAQMKIFTIARDLRGIREMLEERSPSQHSG